MARMSFLINEAHKIYICVWNNLFKVKDYFNIKRTSKKKKVESLLLK